MSVPVHAWEPTRLDRVAEVDHLDGGRRPWRAAGVALLVMALGGAATRPTTAVGLIAVVLAASLAAIVAWRLPIVRGVRPGPVRIPAGVAVTADRVRFTLWRGGLERRLDPAALRAIVVGSDHLFLHLTGAELVTVPCRVFERGGLDRFVDRIERFRRSGPALIDEPDPGSDRWSLHYNVRSLGLSTGNGRSGDLERFVLVGVVVVAFIVLLAATDPLRGGADLWLLGSFAGVAGAMALATRAARGPDGPIALSVGPDGGWIRTASGSARFSWRFLLAIEQAPDGFVFRFADLALPVPRSAFAHADDREQFRVDVLHWWREARRRPAGRGKDSGVPPDPFAPPATER